METYHLKNRSKIRLLGSEDWLLLVAQSWPTLYDLMDYNTPGFPVCHCLPEFARTHVHQVGDAIQPSHAWKP